MKQETGPEKRRFIFLLLLTCLVLVALAAVLWWVPYVGFASIHPHLPLIMAIVFGGAVLFLLGGGLTLVGGSGARVRVQGPNSCRDPAGRL